MKEHCFVLIWKYKPTEEKNIKNKRIYGLQVQQLALIESDSLHLENEVIVEQSMFIILQFIIIFVLLLIFNS